MIEVFGSSLPRIARRPTIHFIVSVCVAATLVALPNAAFAHPGHDTLGFAAGVLHPLTAADHVIAMLAVGLWAAQLGGRARLQLPAVFLGAMLLGIVLAGHSAAWGLEALLPIAVIALAASVILRWRPALRVVSLLVACFALLHGWSHAAEAAGASYIAGVFASTAALHALGVSLGMMIERRLSGSAA